MPLDPMMSDALLGTFKNMVQECRDKNMSGEYFDKMCEHYNRLEELARTHDDVMAFNMQVMAEDVYIKFSDNYSRLLSTLAMTKQQEIGYDDAALLKQNLDTLRDAVKRIRDEKARVMEESRNYDPKEAFRKGMDFAERNAGKNGGLPKSAFALSGAMKRQGEKEMDQELRDRPNAYKNEVEIDVLMKTDLITKPIENLITLGEESGMTYPRYLRIQIEKGLDKAMDGSALVREGLVYILGMTQAMPVSPHHIEKDRQKLELFDKLASESSINIPNSDEFSFGHRRIDYVFDPLINEWSEIKGRWEDMLYDLYIWSLAYCSFAPSIFPWSFAENPRQAVIDTQKTQPGLFRQRERLLKKYFGMGFFDIFKHPTFEWDVRYYFQGQSQEFTEFLIKKIYPVCIPLQDLPSKFVSQRATMYQGNKEQNPEIHKVSEAFMAHYDSVFGEGRYLSKYSLSEKSKSTAAPWNWEQFRYK